MSTPLSITIRSIITTVEVIFAFFLLTAITVIGYSQSDQFAHQHSFIRVTVTSQHYSFVNPWKKKRPFTKRGIGVVIENNTIMVTAKLVANATFIELERMQDHGKCPATVVMVDYGANLALLSPIEEYFLVSSPALPLITDALTIGETIKVWQFEENGTPVITDAELKQIEVKSYPFDNSKLVFLVKITLSNIGSSYTLPLTQGNRFVGLMMQHHQESQTMTIIPPPIINHFLQDSSDGVYEGFPQAGFRFSKLKESPLRRFLGLNEDNNGVFIEYVRPGSPAEKSGLQEGDVLLRMNQFSIDSSGQYNDPVYGKLSIAHLITTRSYAKEKGILHILRDGAEMDVEIILDVLRMEDYPISPYVFDQAPEYIIVGGLIFQELSGQYLREWGRSGPENLFYLHRHQWEMFSPENKIVILSHVLPSEGNVGYERLRYKVIEKINSEDIHHLKDVQAALQSPLEGFHHFQFRRSPKMIYFTAQSLDEENHKIQQRYNLPSLSYLDSE